MDVSTGVEYINFTSVYFSITILQANLKVPKELVSFSDSLNETTEMLAAT